MSRDGVDVDQAPAHSVETVVGPSEAENVGYVPASSVDVDVDVADECEEEVEVEVEVQVEVQVEVEVELELFDGATMIVFGEGR